MYTPAQFESTRREIRILRIENAYLQRFHTLQKGKADRLEEENNKLKKEINKINKEKQKLKEQLEKIKQERDTYKKMVFKGKRKEHTVHAEQKADKKQGAPVGHTGYGRKKPEKIDREVRAYLTCCPTCSTPLNRTDSTDTHTVEDVPHWQDMQSIVTEYEIERQWCCGCEKEVHAVPNGVIPGSRLGVNIVTMIMVWKYRFREPLNKIAERLFTHYGIHVSEGTLVGTLSKAKEWLGEYYQEILAEVRGSPVKHADETGWRVNGQNWWCWTGVSEKSVYYTIEETRGGGVAEDIFKGSVGVLVRDDYKGYSKVNLIQQSCWSHPIRISRDLAERKGASDEIKRLYKDLKDLYELLEEDIKQPFDEEERHKLYEWYKKDIEKIMNAPFTSLDAKKVQTRFRNQNTNLLTALLYEGVPLTNNAAERALRPLVVTRKISGGSKTSKGAKTHAVNISVIETIVKRNLPLLNTLQDNILNGVTGKN